MKQPNLGYADVKLDFACMHPAGCARRVLIADALTGLFYFPIELT